MIVVGTDSGMYVNLTRAIWIYYNTLVCTEDLFGIH